MTGLKRLAAFLRSPHHAWLALLTLGIGLASANVPGMIAAAAAYALGWIFLPDSNRFRRWLSRKQDGEATVENADEIARFEAERQGVYRQLSRDGRNAYDTLATAISEIRRNAGEGESSHAGRLGQMAWTYLRLLLTRETLERFCHEENSSNIEGEVATVRGEVGELEEKLALAENRGDAAGAGQDARLLQSKRSRLDGLERHLEKVRQAEADLALTRAEIERLVDSVRLVRADLVTRRDPDALGGELDRATAHFHRTRDWLRDLEFDQTSADIPDELTATVPVELAG